MSEPLFKLIDLDAISRGDLRQLEPGELPEAIRRASAALSAIHERITQPETPERVLREKEVAKAEENHWLELDEVLAKYPTFTRRQLFGGGLPFVKRTSPRKILISEEGLKRWLERRR